MKKIKRYSRKKIFKGYCFDVVRDDVLWPNKKRLKRDLILHPGISVMVPLLNKRHIVLIRQYRYGADSMLWELPAGTIHPTETPLACAKRELIEEVGYRANRWENLASCYASPGFNTEIIHCFLASQLFLTETALEDDEIIRKKIFSFKDVKTMVRTRKIQDAKSLLALFYFLETEKLR